MFINKLFGKLLNRALIALNVTDEVFEKKLDAYIAKQKYATKMQAASTRKRLLKAVASKRSGPLTFLEALKVLEIKKVSFGLEVQSDKGKTRANSVDVWLDETKE